MHKPGLNVAFYDRVTFQKSMLPLKYWLWIIWHHSGQSESQGMGPMRVSQYYCSMRSRTHLDGDRIHLPKLGRELQDRYRQYSWKVDLAGGYSKMSPFLFQMMRCLCRHARRGKITHARTTPHTQQLVVKLRHAPLLPVRLLVFPLFTDIKSVKWSKQLPLQSFFQPSGPALI